MIPLAELIYNTFLRVSRTRQGKPFRYRKDFSTFEKDPNYVFVMKLENFFRRFKHIKIEEFFQAPYIVYPENTYYALDFYLTQKAIKVYTLYNKQRNDALPDSEIQLAFIRESLHFIYSFCKARGIKLHDYIEHMNELFPSWLIHLKEHDISIYALFGWDNFEDKLGKILPEEQKFVIGHLYDKISTYRTQFLQSTKAKNLIREGIKRLEQHLAYTHNSNK